MLTHVSAVKIALSHKDMIVSQKQRLFTRRLHLCGEMLSVSIGKRAGGKCDAETGCPLCRKKMTTCSQGGTFLPTANRPYSALSIPYECRLCPRGWKSTQTDSFVKGDERHIFRCLKCPPGRFQSYSGSSSCEACAPGSITNTHRVSGAVACMECIAGRYSIDSTIPCTLCDPGSSTMGTPGLTSCVQCSTGRASGPARSDCEFCSPGTFQPYLGQVQCEVCPGGYYQARNGSSFCEQCPEGMKLTSPIPNDASAHDQFGDCSECERVGETSNADRSAGCSKCAEGQFSAVVTGTLDQDGTSEACQDCKPCGKGKSLFKDDGTMSCAAREPGKCRQCGIGFIKPAKDNGGSYKDACTLCPSGMTSNARHDECIPCDYSYDVSTATLADLLSYRATCPVCDDRQFPNSGRTVCQSVVGVRLSHLNNGVQNSRESRVFHNFDEVHVQWTSNSYAEHMSVRLCPLRFRVTKVHRKCDSGGGDAAREVYSNVSSWYECAQLCNRDGSLLFNHNSRVQECEVIKSVVCTRYVLALGWFALEIDPGSVSSSEQTGESVWERGCSSDLDSSLSSTMEAGAVDEHTFTLASDESEWVKTSKSQNCLKDTTFVLARVGLNEVDSGAVPKWDLSDEYPT